MPVQMGTLAAGDITGESHHLDVIPEKEATVGGCGPRAELGF